MKRFNLIFLFCLPLVCGAQHFNESGETKKSTHEIGFLNKTYYTFTQTKIKNGNFQPFELKIPISNSPELVYGFSRKSFKLEVFARYARMKALVLLNQHPDSSARPFLYGTRKDPFLSDTITYHGIGFRMGRVASISQKLSYELLAGVTVDRLSPHKGVHRSTTLYFGSFNPDSNVYYLIPRFHAVSDFSLTRYAPQIEIACRARYLLSSRMAARAGVGFIVSAIKWSKSSTMDYYEVYYQTYPLNGSSKQLSSGSLLTLNNQIQLSLGLSYVF